MSRKTICTLAGVLILAGCASVQVQAPKDPIKMDIAMRLDVYQHVVKDIDDIESIVSGGGNKTVAWLSQTVITTAYADDSLPAAATEAAYRRRDRKARLDGYLAQGVLSEGPDALVIARGAEGSARTLAEAENADRMIIYRGIAAKNGSSVEDVQKVYAERLRGAAVGTGRA